MSKIFTPTNQIRLTNVAVVRMKKAGKRFEVACYRNKVVAWRNEVEKDIDEVLQIHTVFTNVSKGQVANKDDLVKAFGTSDQTEICKKILKQGELQVSDKERSYQLDARFKEIAYTLTDMCINTQTNLPYSIAAMEKVMHEVHYSVKPNQNAKQQALHIIKMLIDKKFPIERVKMRLQVVFRGKNGKALRDKVAQVPTVQIEKETREGEFLDVVFLANPGHYEEVDRLIREESKGSVRLEVISNRVEVSDEVDFC